MVDYAPELVAGLKKVLPTYAEPAESTAKVPCITYLETNRADAQAVNGLQYSTIQVRVRVWTDSRKAMQQYADAELRRMGWRMIGGGGLSANGRFCKILTCESTGQERKSW